MRTLEKWHGLMEAQQGPVNNLNNPIEPAVQQVNNIIINIIILSLKSRSQNLIYEIKFTTKKLSKSSSFATLTPSECFPYDTGHDLSDLQIFSRIHGKYTCASDFRAIEREHFNLTLLAFGLPWFTNRCHDSNPWPTLAKSPKMLTLPVS